MGLSKGVRKLKLKPVSPGKTNKGRAGCAAAGLATLVALVVLSMSGARQQKRLYDPVVTITGTVMSEVSVPVQILNELKNLSPAQALAKEDRWDVPGRAVYCAGTRAESSVDGLVTLACQWGAAVNTMFEGRSLFWYEDGNWKTQPYPEEAVRGIGYFQRLYLDGEDIIVVMNVARGETAVLEQVQVLTRAGSGWNVAWLPPECEWARGHATVVFDGPDYSHFRVQTDSYMDSGLFAESNTGPHRLIEERWVWTRNGYQRVSRDEIPTEYGAVVHFITALVAGDEAQASAWVVGPKAIQEAKALGVPKSASRGYFARNEGSTVNGWGPMGPTFRLLTVGMEDPQWIVRVTRKGDRWLVSSIEKG